MKQSIYKAKKFDGTSVEGVLFERFIEKKGELPTTIILWSNEDRSFRAIIDTDTIQQKIPGKTCNKGGVLVEMYTGDLVFAGTQHNLGFEIKDYAELAFDEATSSFGVRFIKQQKFFPFRLINIHQYYGSPHENTELLKLYE